MSYSIKLCTVELSNGETIGYREGGFGPQTILLVHGNLTSSKHWDILMEKLILKYKVYAIDLRGFGISTYNNPIETLGDFAKDLYLFVKTLDIKDFILVGWSTGGGVSMDFVANYPDLAKKLILIQSIGIKGLKLYKKNRTHNEKVYFTSKKELLEDKLQIKPVIDAIETKNKVFFRRIWDNLIYTKRKPNQVRYEEYLEDMLTQRNHIDVYHALSCFNISEEHNGLTEGNNLVEKIYLPTLIIHGDEDRVILLEESIKTKNAIGENANLVIMKNVGHSPLIDDLDGLIRILDSFIDN